MADRRMFSRAVVEADRFLDLPWKSQALYFHISLNADDDGFIDCVRSLFRILDCDQEDLKPLIDSGHILAFPNNVYVITDWRRQNTVKSDRFVPTVHQDIMNQLQFDEKSKVYSLKTSPVPDLVPDRFHNVSKSGSNSGSNLEPKERDSIGSISNNKGNREKEREGSEVSFSDPGSSSDAEAAPKSKAEPAIPSILMKEPVPKDYRPQYWEDSILKMFWGKFQTENDYYAYTEKYRDEIIKLLDEMENNEGKQPA